MQVSNPAAVYLRENRKRQMKVCMLNNQGDKAMSELKDQDPVITLCGELEGKHPGFGFGRAAREILEDRKELTK